MNGVQVRLEVAFGVDASATPTAGDWVDLTGRMHEYPTVVTCSAREGEGGVTVTLTDGDRHLDPTNDDSPYAGLLLPMRHARLLVDVDGHGTVPLFRGLLEAWPPRWRAGSTTVDVQLLDAGQWFGLQELDDDVAGWPREWSGERIARLLDLASWPTDLRDLDRGQVRVVPDDQPTGNIFRSMMDVVDAEDGDLYVDPDGRVVFRERHRRIDVGDPLVTVGSDGPGIIPAEVDVQATEDLEPRSPADGLINIGTVQLANGEVYRHTDPASIAAYGPREITVRDVGLTEVEARGLAQWDVHRWSRPWDGWVDPITVVPTDLGQLVQLLTLRPGDPAELRIVHPTGGDTVVPFHVESLEHTPGPLWTCRLVATPRAGDGPWAVLRPDGPPVDYGDGFLGLLAP